MLKIKLRENNMHYKVTNITYNQVVTYIMAIAIILSHSIYTYTNNVFFNYGLKILLSIIPLIYIYLFCPNLQFDYEKRKKIVRLGIYYYLIVILYAIIDVSISVLGSYLFRFIIFIPLMTLYFCCVSDKRKIFLAFVNVMLIIATVALFFWIFGTVLGVLQPTGEMYSTWGRIEREHYYWIYFEIPIAALRLPFYRNTGIFGEAPAFCGFLCAALLSERFLGRNKLIKKLILGATILSTVSTTGFLILAYLLIIDIWKYLGRHKIYTKVKKLLIGIIGILFVVVVMRLMFDPSKIASVYIRLSDYINGIKAWVASPIWGWGYQIDTSRFNTGFSNSFSLILVNGGIVLSMIYYVPMTKILLMGLKKKWDLVYWLIGVVLLFFVLVVGYTYYILAILAYGYSFFIDRENITE